MGREIEEIVVDSDQGFLKLKELVGEKDVQITLYSDKEPMFVHYDIESQIQRALRNKIWLDCGVSYHRPNGSPVHHRCQHR